MKARVTKPLNVRSKPDVNSPIVNYLDYNDIVQLDYMETGSPIDGNNCWFKLTTGNEFIWSGGVSAPLGACLPEEDKNQFLLVYRQLKPNGEIRMDTAKSPDVLAYAPVRVPDEDCPTAQPIKNNQDFADEVLGSVRSLKSENRKHVFVYIHGYQLLIPSLKLDLFSHFTNNYLSHKGNQIAKVLFFSWPANGGPGRKEVDDRSVEAGWHFTKKGMFDVFETLSQTLAKDGISLNLIVHSFGHQLLNGMLNPGNKAGTFPYTKPIFKNVFLMASDVTHVALKGDVVKNKFPKKGATDYLYDYSPLKQIAQKVHVIHDRYDYLLHVSTEKFADSGQPADVADYLNVGNYGESKMPMKDPFDFHDLQVDSQFVLNRRPDEKFPFERNTTINENITDDMKAAFEKQDYSNINKPIRIALRGKRFKLHHQYLFTNESVVNWVQSVL